MKPANFAPVYACVYAQLAEVARQHGYALSIHGSLAADFDLVCIPWSEKVSEPQAVVDQITREFAIEQVNGYEQKEHGRIATTISFSFGECRLDLSFMPSAGELDAETENWSGIAVENGMECDRLRAELEALRARVAVVPERRDPMQFGHMDPGQIEADGYNACLDELARLNGKTVSEGLLRRMLRDWESNDTVALWGDMEELQELLDGEPT